MEPEYYTYHEEEQQKPAKAGNRQLIVGLFFGLLMGGVLGYVFGTGDNSLPNVSELFESPILLVTINAFLVFFVLVLVLIKRSVLQPTYRAVGDPATRMRVVILLLVMGLLMAGLFAFYFSARFN